MLPPERNGEDNQGKAPLRELQPNADPDQPQREYDPFGSWQMKIGKLQEIIFGNGNFVGETVGRKARIVEVYAPIPRVDMLTC
jgi:hypothetical protein